MDTVTLRVTGMYCAHCEKRIERALIKVAGVREASADFGTGEVRVQIADKSADIETLKHTIQELGYGTDDGRERFVQIASVLLIILSLYLIFNRLGLLQVLNLFPRIETTMGYGTVFLIGVLTSVHCVVMCGGLNLTQSVRAADAEKSLLRANARYHAGRLLSYTAIGALAGALGSVLTLSGAAKGAVAVIAGCAMILMALRMLGVFSFLRGTRFLKMNRNDSSGRVRFRAKTRLSALFARLAAAAGKREGAGSFVIGLFNGFMPCGPLQTMQLYALSAGSAGAGALSMFLFGLGTVPLMFGVGALFGRLSKRFRRYMLAVSAVLIFLLGIHMASTGFALSGASFAVIRAERGKQAVMSGDVQEVRTQIDYGSYEPITVKIDVPVRWTIFVPEGKLNGCNGEIVASAFGIDVVLQEGENVVTFTPQKAGDYPYTCWMGMIKSNIRVER